MISEEVERQFVADLLLLEENVFMKDSLSQENTMVGKKQYYEFIVETMNYHYANGKLYSQPKGGPLFNLEMEIILYFQRRYMKMK